MHLSTHLGLIHRAKRIRPAHLGARAALRRLAAAPVQAIGRLGVATYIGASCLVVLAAVGVVGLVAHQPLLFPSLGPTAMLFFDSPLQKAAAPRNTLVGHAVAVLAGAVCLMVFGLADHPPVLQEGITGARIGAAAASLALTVLALRLLACPHPPAGATTLIVSLGLLTSTMELVTIMLAVLMVTVLGVSLNRLLGGRHPLWT